MSHEDSGDSRDETCRQGVSDCMGAKVKGPNIGQLFSGFQFSDQLQAAACTELLDYRQRHMHFWTA